MNKPIYTLTKLNNYPFLLTKTKKDINAGTTMLPENITTLKKMLLLKLILMETEGTPYVPPTLCINLYLSMDLSAVLFTLLISNPEPITVVSNPSIYLKLEEEDL